MAFDRASTPLRPGRRVEEVPPRTHRHFQYAMMRHFKQTRPQSIAQHVIVFSVENTRDLAVNDRITHGLSTGLIPLSNRPRMLETRRRNEKIPGRSGMRSHPCRATCPIRAVRGDSESTGLGADRGGQGGRTVRRPVRALADLLRGILVSALCLPPSRGHSGGRGAQDAPPRGYLRQPACPRLLECGLAPRRESFVPISWPAFRIIYRTSVTGAGP